MKNGYRIGPIAKTQPMNSCEKGTYFAIQSQRTDQRHHGCKRKITGEKKKETDPHDASRSAP
jgi:hypothetical protein